MYNSRGDGEEPCPGPFLCTALAPYVGVREDGEQWVCRRVRELFRLPASDLLKPLDKGRLGRADQLDKVRNTNPLWRPRDSPNCGSRTVLRGRRDPALPTFFLEQGRTSYRTWCPSETGVERGPKSRRECTGTWEVLFGQLAEQSCGAHEIKGKSEPLRSTLSRVTPCTWGRWWSGG